MKSKGDERRDEAESRTEAPGAPPPAPPPGSPPSPVEPTLPPTYSVAKGKSLTSLRGTIGELESVSARDFFHGQHDLDRLVAARDVVKS